MPEPKSRTLTTLERRALQLGVSAYERELQTQLDRAAGGDVDAPAVSATNLTPAARDVLEQAAADAAKLLEELTAASRVIVELEPRSS